MSKSRMSRKVIVVIDASSLCLISSAALVRIEPTSCMGANFVASDPYGKLTQHETRVVPKGRQKIPRRMIALARPTAAKEAESHRACRELHF